MLDTPIMSLTEKALDYASVRQEVLSNNVANANTPGYKRQEASFDDVLAMAQGGAAARMASIADTTRQLFSNGSSSESSIAIIQPDGGAMRLDGNNVDMDNEMASLAKNQIYYSALSQMIGGQFTDIKNAIKGE